MVKLYTFHMFNKKVCLSLFSSRFEFLSKQTSFLTLSDADIFSLSFPNNTFQGEIVYYHEWSRPYPRNVNVHEETKTLFGLFFTMNQFAMKMDPMKYVLLCNLFRSSLMLSLSLLLSFPNKTQRSARRQPLPRLPHEQLQVPLLRNENWITITAHYRTRVRGFTRTPACENPPNALR